MSGSIQEELIHFVATELLSGRETEDLDADDDLLATGIVDSLGIMRLVTFLEQQYEVVAPPEDVTIENSRPIAAVARYVEGREDQ